MRWRALACALALVVAGCRSVPEGGEATPQVRRELLALPVVGGGRLPPARLQGKVVLVSFFATWCFPCLVELPTLEALQREYGPQGLQVVSVGMDLEGERVLGPFVELYRLPYPVVVADERMREGRSAFGLIPALPTTFLLDREGQVAVAWQGTASAEALTEAVQKLLKR